MAKAKIYLLHNGIDRGEFFTTMRQVAKSLIDFAAIPFQHPLICDKCLGLELAEIQFDPHSTPLIDGKVYLEFDNDHRLMAIKYIEDNIPEGEEEDVDWLYPDDDECFKMNFLESGINAPF